MSYGMSKKAEINPESKSSVPTAKIKKTIIGIEGMHCASCQSNIAKALKKVKGVKDANVQLLSKKAFIEYEGELNEKDIKKAVEGVGNYKVVGINKEGNEHEQRHENHKEHQMHEHSHHSATATDSEIISWKKKMIWAWIFTIPAAILMFSGRLFGFEILPENTMIIVLLVISFPVVFIFGWGTIKGGFKGLSRFYFNMDLLIALGTIIAYISGIATFFLPVRDYSGVSAMIMSIFLTGKFIESKARGRAGEEIRKLLELGAKKASVLRNKKEIEISISEVKVGDIMIVKPGEKVPTDGIVVKGDSSIDESMVSGESIPVDKIVGSKVIGSTVNQDGVLYIKAEKIGKNTFLANIIKLVEQAQGSKIPIQAFADKVTNIFVPIVLIITVLTFLGWWYFNVDVGVAIGVAIAVLVIACPCALGLATPTALMVGSGMGAKNGILIRKGEAIQTMKEIKTVVFDKTGTITKGKPEVREIYGKVKENYLLDMAANLEKLSEHSLSKAIVAKAGLKKYREVKGFKILRGRGVEGKIGTKNLVIGNTRLMNEKKITLKDFEKKISEFENKGYTTIIVSENGKAIGIMGIADAVKDDSVEAIKILNKEGYKTVMITGDNERTAKAIAKQVGIKDVIANVLPEDKAKKVAELQNSENHRFSGPQKSTQNKDFRGEVMVAFVGDGVNDAPALKQSNVGIAMGSGTDIAIEAGDIVLSKSSLTGVVQAINLSRATFGKIKQNLFFAFFYNVIAIPVAMAGLLHPAIAELAMALSSITVVANANLLRRKRI